VSGECLCCQVGEGGSLRRADHSSRGMLPSVVCGPGPRGSCAKGKKYSHIELYEHIHRLYTDRLQGVKEQERNVDHLPPRRAEVETEWLYASTSPLCLLGM
jgi:hypothetical protein